MKKLALLLLSTLIFGGALAHAQTPLHLTAVEVDLWPEYDRPEMLVIYHVKLPADIALPAEVTLLIPAAAGKPNAVAVRQMDGSLPNATYDRQVNGEWASITVTATMPEIQLEYYDPGLEKSGNLRTFTFTWKGAHPVDAMTINVQEPVGARQLSVQPALGKFRQPSGDPMRYYTMEIGAPQVDEIVTVGVTYRKDTDALSIISISLQPGGQTETAPAQPFHWLAWLPWIIGGVGVGLLIGGGLWYWQMNRAKPQDETARRGRRSQAAIKSPEQLAAESGDQGGVYCPQCGKRATPGDRFCRTCGSRLRVP
jgi:hypothetical protein